MDLHSIVSSRTVLFLIIIVVCSLVFLNHLSGGSGSRVRGESMFNKVLLIGIDGMDPKVARELMSSDKLPNFKRLSESGSFAELETSYPPNSPVAWTSIATGVNPGEHNIFDFIRRNPENYLPDLSLSKSVSGIAGTDYESYVTAVPFWRITSEASVPTTVIRWPVTFPPERIEGNMLSGLGVPDIKGLLSGYTYYTSDRTLETEKASNKVIYVDGVDFETEVYGPRTIKSGKRVDVTKKIRVTLGDDSATLYVDGGEYSIKEGAWSEWIRIKFNVGLFKDVYGTFKARLISVDPFRMYVTTMQIDPVNPVVDISSPSKYSSELAGSIGLYYTLGMPEETDGLNDGTLSDEAFLDHVDEIEAERDRMFWEEFNKFKEQDSGVLALVYDSSDRVQHMYWGEKVLEDDDGVFNVTPEIENYFVRKDEFIGKVLDELDNDTLLLIFSDHGFTSFERSVNLNDWLVENGFMTLKHEIPEGEDGALFKYVDWSKTKAYSLGFNSVYVNLKNREGKGVIEDKEAVVSELIEKLESLRDPTNDMQVVNRAYRREEIYSGSMIEDAPDIVVGFNPGYRMGWQTAIGGFTGEVLGDNSKHWRGDHLFDPQFVPGVIFSNSRLNTQNPSQTDIAPTIVEVLGIKTSIAFDGQTIITIS